MPKALMNEEYRQLQIDPQANATEASNVMRQHTDAAEALEPTVPAFDHAALVMPPLSLPRLQQHIGRRTSGLPISPALRVEAASGSRFADFGG